MTEKEEKVTKKWAGLCLYLLLCVIIFILTVLSFGAYYDYKTSTLKREGLLARIGQQLIDTETNRNSRDCR